MNFRTDINGLRAVAVIAVVLFHFNASWLPGGYAGVDVFFVISGFLMTGIIFKGLDTHSFSIIKFYIARANRIIPALAILCFFLILFGWFFLYNSEYNILAKHVRDSLYFVSNHTYWLESGYFDAGSHEKWLLHTWSLSAEWQFYIAYPLFLFTLSKIFKISTLRVLVFVAAILGFCFCVFASFYWPDAAYFLLPTRAWQMLLGGVAFLYPIDAFKNNPKVEFLGWLLIFGTYIFITSDNLWPGYLALMPVLGAFLIIQSNNSNSKITNNLYFQKIGSWSYSIYLWHWPIVVFINNFIDNVNTLTLVAGIALSFLLGFVSFTLVEKSKFTIAKYSIVVLTLVMSSYISHKNGAITPLRQLSQSPVNEFVLKYKSYQINRPQTLNYDDNCTVSAYRAVHGDFGVAEFCLSPEKSGGIFLWGDSHIGALAHGLRDKLSLDMPISQVTSSGCPSSFTIMQGNISRLREACDYANALALSSIAKIVPDTVIIANKDNHQKMDWGNTVTKLKQLGVKQVILVGPVPQWYPSLPLVYAKKAFGLEILASQKIDKNVVKTNIQMLDIAKSIPDLIYIDVLNNICEQKQNTYHCKVIYDDELLAWDYGHLTLEGARFVSENYILPNIVYNIPNKIM